VVDAKTRIVGKEQAEQTKKVKYFFL